MRGLGVPDNGCFSRVPLRVALEAPSKGSRVPLTAKGSSNGFYKGVLGFLAYGCSVRVTIRV